MYIDHPPDAKDYEKQLGCRDAQRYKVCSLRDLVAIRPDDRKRTTVLSCGLPEDHCWAFQGIHTPPMFETCGKNRAQKSGFKVLLIVVCKTTKQN